MATPKKITWADKSVGPENSQNPIHLISADDLKQIKDGVNDHADHIQELETLVAGIEGGSVVRFDQLTPAQIEALRGLQGPAFTYDKFTAAQLEGLKVKGDKMTFADLTAADRAALKGEPFTYDMLTSTQRDALKGAPGTNGWTPVLGALVDGERVLMRLLDYTGGTGNKPTTSVGSYLSSTGYTTVIANATNFRGPAGAPPAVIPLATVAESVDNALNFAGQPATMKFAPATTAQLVGYTIPVGVYVFEV